MLLAPLAGCGSEPEMVTLRGSNAALSSGDFSGDSNRTVAAHIAQYAPAAPAASGNGADASLPAPFDVNGASAVEAGNTRISSADIIGEFGATDGISDVRAEPGPPAARIAAQTDPVPIGEEVLVEAKVGDVNGKPIYASRFLAPMAARLRTEAAQRPLVQWQLFAKREIERALAGFVEDELLRAEALASLSPAQKQGLFAFVERVQQDFVAQNRGSREQASRRLFQEEGTTIEQFTAARRERELINFQLETQVNKRVSVTWRDIQQAYERNYEQFNTPPTFRFRLIRVLSDNTQDVQAVTDALAAGTPFADVAAMPANANDRANKGLVLKEVKGDPSKMEFFPNPDLDAAAKEIGVGEVVGPVDMGTSKAWLTLEAIDQRSVPLYQAQLGIENVLRENRQTVERARYIDRLKDRANISNPEETVERLLEIATDRYYTAARPNAQPD